MKRIKSKQSKKLNKIFISVLFAILSITGGLFGIGNYMQARAAGAPSVQKKVVPNGDGTYTIALDVKGDSEKNYNKANVIVILDSSGSMREETTSNGYYPTDTNGDNMYGYIDGNYVKLTRHGGWFSQTYYTYVDSNGTTQTYTGTRYLYSDAENRMAAAKGAVTDLARALLANNTESGNGSDLIEIALIDFDTNATIVQQPTTSIDTFVSSLAGVEQGGGTNWEAALQKAASIDFEDPANEKNTTYVIFVSDGNPTFHITDDGYGDYHSTDGGTRIYGTGQEDNINVTNCYNSAKDDARALVDPKKYEFYTIGVYGNVDRMEDLTKYALNTTDEVENKNYFKAEDTFKLQEALNKILQKIELAGFGDITVNDGTTKNVSVSSGTEQGGLIDVDTNSFKYYLSFPITVNGNTITSGAERIKSIEKNSDGTYKITNDKNQVFNNVVRVPELDDNGNEIATVFKMAWTSGENNPFYDRTAPAAELDSNNAVVWNLDELGVLFDEVTYRVTFEVWPSQAALDLIADLKNGKITYGASTDDLGRQIDPKVWTYLDRNYGIKTNTNDAYVEYTDTRVENDTPHKVNFQTQDPISSASAKLLTVTKEWENKLDSRDSTDISLKVKRGNEVRYDIELPLKDEDGNRILDEDDNPIWSNSVYASVGIMTDTADGVNIKAAGHDYSFAEEQDIAYYWELNAPIVHPMWINGEVDSEGNAITTMLVKQDSKPEGMADDVTKATIGGKTYYKISGNYYVVDNQLAELTATNNRRSYLQITKEVDGKDAPADALFTYNVKVTDSEGKAVWFSIYDPATKEYIMNKPGSENEPAVNYISGTGVGPEVKLLIEKPEYAENFRKINHANGSDVITYEYCDHSNTSNDCSANSEDWKAYTVKYVSGNSNDTYRYYTGFYTAPSATDLTILIQKGWSLRFINLPTETNYEVTESAMPEHFSFVSVTGDGTVDETNKKKITGEITETNSGYKITYTNKYELTSVKVTKDWQDNDNQDGKRVPVTFSLYKGNTKVENMSITVDGTPDEETEANKNKRETAAWVATFANLDRFDEDGEEIAYTVDEDSVPADYEKVGITGDINSGFVISNRHVPEKYDEGFDVTKTWVDFDNKNNMRPQTIKIKLVGTIPNGENTKKVYEKEVTIGANTEGVTTSKDTDNNDVWTYTFKKDDGTNLDKYAEGELITYTLSETSIVGYNEPSIENYNITNTLDSIDIPVTKEWVDDSDRDGVRPDNIKLTLKANGEVIDTMTINKQLDEEGNELNSWTDAFRNLNRLDKNGVEITYTVEEADEDVPEGYEKSTGCDDDGNTIIYNTHTIETDDVTVTKIWEDDSNRDGVRPEKITLILKADGKQVKEIELNAKDGNSQSYTFTDMPVNRDGGTLIIYTADEASIPTGYTKDDNPDDLTVTNTHTIETDDVTVTKVWEDDSNRDGSRPDKITLILKADGKQVKEIELNAKDGNSQSYTFTDMPVNHDGGTSIIYTADEASVPENYSKDTDETDLVVTNSYSIETDNIKVTKVWEDDSNRDGVRPEKITLILKADGKQVKEIELNAKDGNSQSYTFTDMPVNHDGGTPIIYTADEASIPTGYTKDDNPDDLTVTNTHNVETDDVTVTKVWEDDSNRDGVRPEKITLILKADGKQVKEIELNAKDGNSQSYTFTDMPVNHDGGTPIIYTADEASIPTGYTKDDNPDDLTVTNSYKITTKNITVKKVWDDESNSDGQRPKTGATIHLLDGDTEIEGMSVTLKPGESGVMVSQDGNTLSYTFIDVPVYKDGGTEIKYDIKEDPVGNGYNNPLYSATNNGNTLIVTNPYETETVDITVTKVWEDDSDRDGVRPESITLLVLDGTTEVDRHPINAKNGNKMSWTFTGLPKYKNGGTEIVYTVDELNVDGYDKNIDNDNYIITNSKDYQKIDIPFTKEWIDEDDQDGLRPTCEKGGITVNLLDGKDIVATQNICGEDDTWSGSFTGMPKFKNHGELITYTLQEVDVDGYTSTVSGNKITNKHTPELTSVNGSKVWVDAGNIEGFRPTKDGVTVRLYADDTEIDSQVVKGEGDEWTYSFNELPKYRDHGVEIVYTVSEDPVENYEEPDYVSATGDENKKYVIVNTHNPNNVSITAKKVWEDTSENGETNIYGHPDSVKIILTGSVGEDPDPVVNETWTLSANEVDDDGNWTHTFTDLPEYRKGMLVTYMVDEVPSVKDYHKDVTPETKDGIITFTVTNTYKIEDYTVISGSKTWDDDDDRDGLRPGSITIKVTDQFDNVVATQEVTEDDDWEYEIKLPKYGYSETDKDFVELTYTVNEVDVDGYESEVTGYDVTNTHEIATVSYHITKVWTDNTNNDGLRPESITVRIIDEDTKEEYDKAKMSGENNWYYAFDNLPKYKNGGEEIKYKIIEDPVAGYTYTVKPTEDNNGVDYILENTHEDSLISIIIKKIWDDYDDISQIRPDEITVDLYAEEEIIRTIIVKATDNWEATIEDLNEFNGGVKINYSIKEREIPEYEVLSITKDQNTFTITNHHELGTGGDTPEELPPQTGIIYNNRGVMVVLMNMLGLAFVSRRTKED